MTGALALDFGATSGRYAAGRLVDGRIEFQIIEQVPHSPVESADRLCWDLDALVSFCQRAEEYGVREFSTYTLGIDTWGVDHGFIAPDGKLLAAPVCYRDRSHLAAFQELAPHRNRLYELTGCQHQPFNTICQLLARRHEDSTLPKRARWMILPDLMGYLRGGQIHHELTQASTTQLLGLDGKWCEEAFDMIGWPVPELQPALPGKPGNAVPGGRLAHVGSHDTASAVCGFGSMADDQLFLNAGTWSLAGTILDQPLATREAGDAGFTNERTVDGRVRFLKNIPGFYIVNRVHEELGVSASVPEWLSTATKVDERIDLLHADFFNPESMLKTCASLVKRQPKNDAEWAGLTLASLTRTIAQTPKQIERLTGRKFTSIRVGGGGSQNRPFCQSLARESGLMVLAGPAEATVMGNLAMQFLASGAFGSHEEMRKAVDASTVVTAYEPV